MMRVFVVVVPVLFSVGANAFSASSNRVFVGTPVSNFPKHLGKRESQREEEKYTPLERYRVMFRGDVRLTHAKRRFHMYTASYTDRHVLLLTIDSFVRCFLVIL